MKAARREGGAAAANRAGWGTLIFHTEKRKNKRFPAAVDVDRGPLATHGFLCGLTFFYRATLFELHFWSLPLT